MDSLNFIYFCLKDNIENSERVSGSFWTSRSMVLIKLLIKLSKLENLNDSEKEKLLKLDFLLKYKNESYVRDFLMFLPGYIENQEKISVKCYKNFGFLSMSIVFLLKNYKEKKEGDIINSLEGRSLIIENDKIYFFNKERLLKNKNKKEIITSSCSGSRFLRYNNFVISLSNNYVLNYNKIKLFYLLSVRNLNYLEKNNFIEFDLLKCYNVFDLKKLIDLNSSI